MLISSKECTMVPGIKIGRRKRATSGNVLSASEACPQEIGTPLTLSDETQSPDDTQIVDKFVINDDFDNDEQAQQILDRKAYLLYKDWRYNLKQEFLELEEKGVDDPYSHPPSGVSLEDWKYLIDVAWKDESHLANKDGDIDFPKFYKKSHKSKKTGDWIDPKYGELHDDMVNLQVVATNAGLPLTHEELSRQVLGAKKNYLRGFGIGPQPFSIASSSTRARDKHMESRRAELEVLREERQRDHEELLKEKEEHQRDHEELLKEKEECQRDHEELLKEKEEHQRDRKEIMREREEQMK
ncbi:hypothetical protein ACSBR2_037778 [Camellia fascicularis]